MSIQSKYYLLFLFRNTVTKMNNRKPTLYLMAIFYSPPDVFNFGHIYMILMFRFSFSFLFLSSEIIDELSPFGMSMLPTQQNRKGADRETQLESCISLDV